MPGTVVISIFNSLGQIVRKYNIGYTERRAHELVFDASNFTSGVYFYKVDAEYA